MLYFQTSGCLPSFLSLSEFKWKKKSGSGVGGAVPANSTITAYGVRLYRDIRRAFGVSEETFLASLGIKQVLGES